MTGFTQIAPSFNGGELSRRMEGRVDTAIYQVAAAEMVNFVPAVEGPAVKRPGFRYIEPAMTTAAWLSAFVFNRTQAYVIEWGDAALRFYTNDERIESSPGVAYEVAVPYTAAQAPSVSQQQSFDRLHLAHSAHPPAALTRTGGSTFAYAAVTLKNGPFADQNIDTAKTVTTSGTSGSVTVTASAAIFLAGHVGAVFRLEAKDFSDIPAWEVGIDGIVIGSKRRSDGRVYVAASAGRTGSVQPTHSRGTEWDGMATGNDINANPAGGVKWTYLHDRFGVGTITAVAGDGLSATVTVTRQLPDSVTSVATHRWSLPFFSLASSWPRHVILAFGRLIYFTDFDIVASVVGDYGGGTINMADYTESGLLAPDMAFRRRLSVANPILWVREDRDILIGTADGEYVIRKINSAEIFSSDNIECVKQSHYGSAEVLPVQIGTSTLFVQKSGRKIRAADYTLDRDRYVSPNVAVWQRHILKSGARQLVFQQEPEELVWAVRADGVLAVHAHVPEQDIKGFARATHAAGPVLSAVAIPSTSGQLDDLWVLVDGAGGKSVEQQAAWWEEEETSIEDAFFVDSGVSYDDVPAATFTTGLTHLAGREVSVLADGGVVAGLSVSAGGVLELPIAASKVHVGLGYQARIRTLRPEGKDAGGNTIQGKRKRLVSIITRLLETVGIKIDPGNGRLEQLIDRPGSAPMNAPVPPFSGDTTSKSLSGSWERDGQYTIISDDPLPCIVMAAMTKVELGA
jgi:hypothetical protein